MKKYLQCIIVLLALLGVCDLYGQKPTATISVDKDRFCGGQLVTFTIVFEGSGTYDYDYEFFYEGLDNPIQPNPDPIIGPPNLPYTKELKITFPASGYIKFLYVHDDNYPIGGEPGLILDENGNEFDGRINIIVDQKPTPIINNPIKTCDLDVHLNASKEFPSSTAQWSLVNSSDGTLNNADSEHAIFTAVAEGDYNLIFAETQGTCVTTVPVVVQASENKSPTASIKTPIAPICEGERATVELDLTGSFPLTVDYSDGVNQIEETESHEIITDVLNDNAVIEIIKVTDDFGCETLVNQSGSITVNAMPDVNPGTDLIECGNEVELQAELSGDFYGEWVYEPAPQYFSDASLPNSLFTIPVHVFENGQEVFNLTWKVTNNANENCFDEKSIDVILHKPPEAVIVSDYTEMYFATDTILVTQSILPDMKGWWEVIESPSTTTDFEYLGNDTTEVSKLVTGNYTVKWTVSNGDVCADFEQPDEISFENKGLYVTTGFSPNSTHHNTFKIGGANNVEDNKLVVFDSAGKVVFEADGFMKKTYLDGWDGKRNDSIIEDGTYYYIFTGKHDGKEIAPIKSYLIIKGS